MSRIYKFRAWLIKEKVMVEVAHLQVKQPKYITTRRKAGGIFFRGRYELMQYTGLKDKNGKEIYEGDIGTGVDRKGYPFSGVVFWKDGGFRIKTYDSKHGEPLFFFKEVVGNIYENKELLK